MAGKHESDAHLYEEACFEEQGNRCRALNCFFFLSSVFSHNGESCPISAKLSHCTSFFVFAILSEWFCVWQYFRLMLVTTFSLVWRLNMRDNYYTCLYFNWINHWPHEAFFAERAVLIWHSFIVVLTLLKLYHSRVISWPWFSSILMIHDLTAFTSRCW